MDIFGLASMIGGVAIIIIGLFLSGGVISDYVEPTSVFITIGGALAATAISFPLSTFMTMGSSLKLAFRSAKFETNDDIEMIVSIANVARKEGLLALEDSVSTMDDPFLKKGIMLIVDGSPPELVKNIMETDIMFTAERHRQARDVFEVMAGYAPAFGMIGTLIGLVNMLNKLSDINSLGPNMATALITTLYGTLMANLFCKPIAKKLESLSANECFQKELMLEGMLSIQDGENPRLIREKLNAFISRTSIAAYESKSGGGAAKPAASGEGSAEG